MAIVARVPLLKTCERMTTLRSLRKAVVASALVLGIALTACAPAMDTPPAASPRPVEPAPTSTTPPSAQSSAPDRGVAPASMTLEAIGLDARVLDVGAPDRVLEVPDSPWDVGWWRDGVGVGGDHGTAVMIAHIASPVYGTGPLARASELRGGETAFVTTATGTVLRYEVARVDAFLKTVLPYDELFRQDGPPRIVLVTCGGEWDARAGHYDSNIVVQLLRVDV